MKKNLLLFSRCDLVHLYGRLDKYLSKDFNIIHLAYSKKEEEILKNDYYINNIINFKNETFQIYVKEKLNVELCNIIDSLIIEQTQNRFCLNSAIQSDRTFQYLEYNDCLLLCQIYYKFWNNIIMNYKIDFIIHEPTALYITQIASILCNKYGGKYLAQIHGIGENKYDWFFVEGDIGIPFELNYNLKHLNNIEIERVKAYIEEFRNESTVLFSEYIQKVNTKKNQPLIKFVIILFRIIIRHLITLFRLTKKIEDTVFNHIELHSQKFKPSFYKEFRNKWNAYFRLKFDEFNPTLKYYYYPIHLEPEAVVLYWGDGLYKNQVKLIENIAAQIPPDHYLFVKDHPHAGLYRDFADYTKIKTIPNIKLIDPNIPGKEIIKSAIAVITINGTGGFEGILFNKHVFTFGNSFYNECNRVTYIKNVKELRKNIYAQLNKEFKDDNELFMFINAYLKSLHPGFVNYFLNRSELLKIDDENNAKLIAKNIINSLQLGQ
ncbi:MAG: hypothetical protein A2W99_16780 [Bacteroidetes bacterium GWF2_33_16]|nr:MAG: hypothetical protein A2X00_14015 [Bacteroidetes bacterium GWE2_32_14]OFY03403.1 MAG: hypothetical protein A2W99_16780 [Bacteroidetes bacterium GWF2_33_16]